MQKPQLTLGGDEFNDKQQELYLSVSDKNDLRKWVDAIIIFGSRW